MNLLGLKYFSNVILGLFSGICYCHTSQPKLRGRYQDGRVGCYHGPPTAAPRCPMASWQVDPPIRTPTSTLEVLMLWLMMPQSLIPPNPSSLQASPSLQAMTSSAFGQNLHPTKPCSDLHILGVTDLSH